MSADGNIEIQVKSEGADEAAGELADRTDGGGGVLEGGGPPPSGGGEDEQGLLQTAKGGVVLGLIAGLLGGILKLLKPLGGFLSATVDVLQAFLAPIGLIIMRLMMPFLRLAIRLLPAWFKITQDAMDTAKRVQNGIWNVLSKILPYIDSFTKFVTNPGQWLYDRLEKIGPQVWSAIRSGASWIANGAMAIARAVWDAISNGASWIVNGAKSIGSQVWKFIKNGASWIANGAKSIADSIWSYMRQLPSMIASALRESLPSTDFNVPSRGDVDSGIDSVLDRGRDAFGDPGTDVAISLEGGLDAFVEKANRDNNFGF